jgi:hypothetical protein
MHRQSSITRLPINCGCKWQVMPPSTCSWRRLSTEANVAEGLRDACIEYGIPIELGDLAYYLRSCSEGGEMLNATGA